MGSYVTFKQKEADFLPFNLTDVETRQPLNLTNATLFLGVKADLDDVEYLISKEHDSFTITEPPTLGQCIVFLDQTDLDLPPGNYLGELKISYLDGRIKKPLNEFILVIRQAITT